MATRPVHDSAVRDLPRVLAEVVDWLEHRGFELRASREFSCEWNEKIVYYRYSPYCLENGLYHELGHVIQDVHPGPRYQAGYRSNAKRKTFRHVADVVGEEIDAWYKGFNLAKSKAWPLDERRYWRQYGTCVRTYFKEAAR